MKSKLYFKPAILLFAIMLVSCDGFRNCIKGDGNIASETRIVEGNFHGVEVDGSFEVFIRKSTETNIRIEADSNILPYVFTRLRSGRLVIDNDKQCFKTNRSIRVYITTPFVDELILDGSGTLECDSIDADNVLVELNGSGIIYVDVIYSGLSEVFLDGSGYITLNEVTTESFDVLLDGSGEIVVEDVLTNDINLDHEGSGSIICYRIDAHQLTANLDGSGIIQLEGDVDRTDLSITGSGNIKAFRLYQSDCDAFISGSGTIYVFVYDYLFADITSSGYIFFRGNPVVTLIDDTPSEQVVPNN